MKLEPIRLRLVPREPLPEQRNTREAFWRSIGYPIDQKDDLSETEGELRRKFGPALRQLLIEELSEPLRQIDDALYRFEFRNLERLIFRFFESPNSGENWDKAQTLDAITRLLEQRQQAFRESETLRKLQDRVAAASTVIFSVRLAGYSSLNLDLSLGSIKSVAEAFDNDFESFRVFLEAFVPEAFARVFQEENANRLDFFVQIPAPYEQAFAVTSTQTLAPRLNANVFSPSAAVAPPMNPGRERAEWLWRLANGSLLVPLLLALAVMYYGMAMLKDLRGSQNEALKPILEHQLKLLEEDRHRLFKEPNARAAPTSAISAPAK